MWSEKKKYRLRFINVNDTNATDSYKNTIINVYKKIYCGESLLSEPLQHTITTKFFDRDPKLAEQCKEKAKNKCECCGKIIGEDKINNIPELQAHHKTPLSKGGRDNLNNLEALCPNCHRKKHIDMNSDEE